MTTSNEAGPGPKKKKRNRVLSAPIRSILVDRLEAAVDANLIDLMEDSRPVKTVTLTRGELRLLLTTVLFPKLPPPA